MQEGNTGLWESRKGGGEGTAPMVTGSVNRTVHCGKLISQANVIRVDAFHFSDGNHCKGSDLKRDRKN